MALVERVEPPRRPRADQQPLPVGRRPAVAGPVDGIEVDGETFQLGGQPPVARPGSWYKPLYSA